MSYDPEQSESIWDSLPQDVQAHLEAQGMCQFSKTDSVWIGRVRDDEPGLRADAREKRVEGDAIQLLIHTVKSSDGFRAEVSWFERLLQIYTLISVPEALLVLVSWAIIWGDEAQEGGIVWYIWVSKALAVTIFIMTGIAFASLKKCQQEDTVNAFVDFVVGKVPLVGRRWFSRTIFVLSRLIDVVAWFRVGMPTNEELSLIDSYLQIGAPGIGIFVFCAGSAWCSSLSFDGAFTVVCVMVAWIYGFFCMFYDQKPPFRSGRLISGTSVGVIYAFVLGATTADFFRAAAASVDFTFMLFYAPLVFVISTVNFWMYEAIPHWITKQSCSLMICMMLPILWYDIRSTWKLVNSSLGAGRARESLLQGMLPFLLVVYPCAVIWRRLFVRPTMKHEVVADLSCAVVGILLGLYLSRRLYRFGRTASDNGYIIIAHMASVSLMFVGIWLNNNEFDIPVVVISLLFLVLFCFFDRRNPLFA